MFFHFLISSRILSPNLTLYPKLRPYWKSFESQKTLK